MTGMDMSNYILFQSRGFWHNNGSYSCLLLQPTRLKQGQFKRWWWAHLERWQHNIRDWETAKNEEWFEFEENDGAWPVKIYDYLRSGV
jgi:hypothetical protein